MKMDVFTKENSSKTRNMVKVYICGLEKDLTKVDGVRESNMVRVR